uniref:Uncharacterized protein n=1 Tax=Zooxanthella nutricula TaxID=1333877 RepID=A0A7S2PJ69_9DINO
MYSWKAISATISIFSAVLIFQGFNGLVEAYILEGAGETEELVISFVHMFLWFISLQVVLAIICGVLPVKGFDPHKENLAIMESRLKTFAILLGHITGFAAINAFAVLQQQVPRNLMATFLVAPVAWVFIYAMGRATDATRERVVLLDNNTKDPHEELWDDETEETENDVAGLAVSFCFVQSVRFIIGGHLPDAEGKESGADEASHTEFQAMCLFVLGVVLAVLEGLRVVYAKIPFRRLDPQMKNIMAMTFSWCVFFGTDWFLSDKLFHQEQGMMKQVTLALSVTVMALLLIFLLEQIQDFKHLDAQLDKAIRAIVNSIGILIGVAWEKAFDVAVAEITETVKVLPGPLTKIILSICLAGLVVPAWYRHILPNIQQFEAEEEGEAGGEREGGEEQAAPALERGASLKEPLLNGTNSDEFTQLKATIEDYRRTVAQLMQDAARADELERKNVELEGSLQAISAELGELGKIAGKLTV